MNLQLTRQMRILIQLPLPTETKKKENLVSWKTIQFMKYLLTCKSIYINWANKIQIELIKLTCQGRISEEIRNIAAIADAWKETTNPPASLFQNKSYARSPSTVFRDNDSNKRYICQLRNVTSKRLTKY